MKASLRQKGSGAGRKFTSKVSKSNTLPIQVSVTLVETSGGKTSVGHWFRSLSLPFIYLKEYVDALSMVTIVGKKYEGFTCAEIKRTDALYKTLERLGNPTVGDFEKMVHANQIQNCIITFEDITNTKVIFGPHLSGVRRKTVRLTHKQVDSDRVTIPREFQILHKSVTLVANVFFLNGITFYCAVQEALFCDRQTHKT